MSSRVHLEIARVRALFDDAYTEHAFVTFQVTHGWPPHLGYHAGDPELDVYVCHLCRHERRGAPDVWAEYYEQADIDKPIGEWNIEVCSSCLEHDRSTCLLVDALIHHAQARVEFHDADHGTSRAARRMKDAQLSAAANHLAAQLAPLLVDLGCDRESAIRAMDSLGGHWDRETLDAIVDEQEQVR